MSARFDATGNRSLTVAAPNDAGVPGSERSHDREGVAHGVIMMIKICGITNQTDATAAMEGGATALGFNFYRRSPRYIAPDRAAEISTSRGVRRVGVFVDEQPARVDEIARIAHLDVVQ